MGSLSIWHWLIVLVIVMLIFGTKKLRNIGADLGGAVRGFKDGMREGTEKGAETAPATLAGVRASRASSSCPGRIGWERKVEQPPSSSTAAGPAIHHDRYISMILLLGAARGI